MQTENSAEFGAVAEKKSFQQIEKVPDVEVIKPDGTVIKAKSIESHDNLDKIVSKEVEVTKSSDAVKTEPAKQERQSETTKTPVVVARPAETQKAQTQEVKKSEPQGRYTFLQVLKPSEDMNIAHSATITLQPFCVMLAVNPS